jgi:uncharacterized membrane protein YoaK (UPF0700 family)
MTKLKLNKTSLKKETPKKVKRIANAILAITPLIQGAILEAPISETHQKWGIFLVSILTIAIKFLSYFFVEDETEDPIDSII